MGVLLVISKFQDSSTVFEVAERMARGGQKVAFLFKGEACRHLTDPEFMTSIGFAEGVHCLESGLDRMGREKPFEGVRLIDYSGWVDLVEAYDNIVSWA